jgi:hypothetical protein
MNSAVVRTDPYLSWSFLFQEAEMAYCQISIISENLVVPEGWQQTEFFFVNS